MKTTTEYQVEPYSKLALFYDGMMEHVDYRHWAKYIDAIFKKTGRSVCRVCELACGTGTLAIELSKRGYKMTCSDISSEMVEVAKNKAAQSRVDIEFSVQNMLDFRSDKKFDAVLCLYDSINYLLDPSDLMRCLLNAAELINDGDIFIFDACTEHNSLKNFNQRYEYDKTHDYRRRSYYVAEQRIQVNEITVHVNGNFYFEKHTQNIFPLFEIIKTIERSSFRLMGIYENLTFRKGKEDSERVHFVLEKTSKPQVTL